MTANTNELSSFLKRTKDIVPSVITRDNDGFPTRTAPGSIGGRVTMAELVRSMNTTTATDLVPGGKLQGVAPALGGRAFLAGLGAQFIQTHFPEAIELPFFTADLAADWISEEEETAISADGAISSRPISSHTVRCHTEISRRLKTLSPSVEKIMAAAILRAITKSLQAAAINGSGSNNEPLGLVNISAVQSLDAELGFTAETMAAAVEMLELSEADPMFFGVLAHPRTKKKLSAVPFHDGAFWRADASSPTKQVGGGFAAASSLDVPEGKLIVGDFSQLLIVHNDSVDLSAIMGGPTYGRKGSTGLFAFLDADVVVRHADAFVVINNV